MTQGKLGIVAAATLLLLTLSLLAGCGDNRTADEDAGLSRADVEEIVQAAITAQPQPGLSRVDVEEIVATVMAGLQVATAQAGGPQPEPGLSRADVEGILQAKLDAQPEPDLALSDVRRTARHVVATIPPKSAPAEYTRFFVENAISRYEEDGLESTLAYYNSADSVDGQWYVFIIDVDGKLIGHYNTPLIGEDLSGPVATDANGYNFGPEMLSSTEDGKWVSYVYTNPESGKFGGLSANFEDLELKNVWVKRHDGLLFASGWYIDADEFTRKLVSIAVDRFRDGGLEATVQYFANPGSALAGLESAIAYYNDAETVDGRWSAFIAADGDTVVAHSDPSLIGKGLEEVFGAVTFDVAGDGDWVATDSLRMYVAEVDGWLFGSGWHRDETGS